MTKKNDDLTQVSSRPEKKTEDSVVKQMIGSNDSTKVFSLRVTEDELREIDAIVADLKKTTRKANRNSLLRACFHILKTDKKDRFLKALKDLP